MAWQLIFKAPDEHDVLAAPLPKPEVTPPPRRPVSMSLQLDPGTMVVVPAAGDDDDDVD